MIRTCLPLWFLLAACGRPADPPAAPAAIADRIRLVVSGSLLGRLEPCGCAGGQLGGLARRLQHLGEQRSHDLLVEGGDLVAGATELDLRKAYTALAVLFDMQHPYDALGVGRNDLALPFAEWCALLQGRPVVATDLRCAEPGWPGVPFVEKDVRGTKVRILSFTVRLPADAPRDGAPVRIVPPVEAYALGLRGADPATLRVLLVHDGDLRTRELVTVLQPKPDLVLCFDHGYTDPGPRPERLDGVPIAFPGTRGRMLLDLTLARLPEGPRLGQEIVPLVGSRTLPGGGGDPDVKQMLLSHREQVRADSVLAAMAEQRPTANGSTYTGSRACESCHPTAYAAWQKSRHAQAWQTLERAEAEPKRYGWPVTAYPDCVGCHVVGYGERSGFVGPAATPHLAAVGCETCHGAGLAHVESDGEVRLGKVGAGTPSPACVACHDAEQSPDFVYGDRWPKIEHALEPGQRRAPGQGAPK
ncbi:MAG: hypothetical protein FJ265_04490 [Planctomycetes bacterium]|nr:hypothetical protein [Planctomycetota bacterium]